MDISCCAILINVMFAPKPAMRNANKTNPRVRLDTPSFALFHALQSSSRFVYCFSAQSARRRYRTSRPRNHPKTCSRWRDFDSASTASPRISPSPSPSSPPSRPRLPSPPHRRPASRRFSSPRLPAARTALRSPSVPSFVLVRSQRSPDNVSRVPPRSRPSSNRHRPFLDRVARPPRRASTARSSSRASDRATSVARSSSRLSRACASRVDSRARSMIVERMASSRVGRAPRARRDARRAARVVDDDVDADAVVARSRVAPRATARIAVVDDRRAVATPRRSDAAAFEKSRLFRALFAS